MQNSPILSNIVAQEHAVDILFNAINQDKLAHSYLFYGHEGVGKVAVAIAFAMAINCTAEKNLRPCGVCNSCLKISNFNHPDFVYIFPTPNFNINAEGEIKDKKALEEFESYLENRRKTPWKEFFFSGNSEIRIDLIRMVQHRISLSRSEGRYKIFLIEKAEQMNQNAANAFLKTLEEPPDDVVIILTTSRPESFLPTISSRCQKISFNKLSRKSIEKILSEKFLCDAISARTYSRIADGNAEKAINLADSHKAEARQKMLDLIDIVIRKDDIAFIAFAEAYKSLKTSDELSEIYQYLIIWLGDISFYLNCPDEVTNIDTIEQIEQVIANSPAIDDEIAGLVLFVEDMLKRINGNVNPLLVNLEIYHRLKKEFFPD